MSFNLGPEQLTEERRKQLPAIADAVARAKDQVYRRDEEGAYSCRRGEAATGLALLIVPSLVGRLLLGEELTGVAIPVARVAGIALIAFGVACWPGPPLVGMLTYSAAVTLYLAYVGFAGGLTGILLWPAVRCTPSCRSCLRANGG